MDGNAVIGFDANEVFRSASLLASKGIQVVRLYGVREDGSCTCGKGAACATPGKHPAGGDGWQHRATCDEDSIASWLEGDDRFNIGIRLGRESRIIDVEVDTPEAQEVLEQFGLHEVDTPTYQASRGEHRLFRFDDRLPDVAVVKVGGLEVRTGGGGRAAQSVAPGSWHKSGKQYEWLPGKSIDDVDPAAIPEHFLRAILENSTKKGSGVAAQARAATAAGRVFYEGEGRHDHLYREAINLARTERDVRYEEGAERVHQFILGLNERLCRPPYPEHEVRRCTTDAINWVLDQRDRGQQRTAWEKMGLLKNAQRPREYEPGTWQLTVVHSDPVEYVISGVLSPSAGTVSVTLNTEEFMSPSKAAKKILATTTDVDPTSPTPHMWKQLWDGFSYQNGDDARRNVPGLKSRLLDTCAHEDAPAEYRRHARVAAWLLDYLRRFKKPTSEDVTEPNASGSPKWIHRDGRHVLAFRFEDSCSKAAAQAGGRIEDSEVREMGRRIRQLTGESQFSSGSQRGKGGSPGFRFLFWNDKHIAALEQIAGVESAQR